VNELENKGYKMLNVYAAEHDIMQVNLHLHHKVANDTA